MATIKIILRKDKISKKNNKAPLYARITQNRKSRFIALGINIEPKYWDEDKCVIKRGEVNYKELNAYLLHKRAEIERKTIELSLSSNNVTSGKIKEIIKRKSSNIDFFEFSSNKIEELKEKLNYTTHKRYYAYLQVLERYNGSRNLKFNEIDIDFIKDFEKYQYNVLDNTVNTFIGYFKFIKSMFNRAIKDGVINNDLYVFKNYEIKHQETKIKYLNEEQFKQVLEYKNVSKKYQVYYDMYIFSCYAGGLRISDVLTLKWKDYIEKEQRVIKIIRKTGRKHQVKLPLKANEIVLKYKTNEVKQDDYIFPLLRKEIEGVFENILDTTNNNIERFNTQEKLNARICYQTKRANFTMRKVGKEIDLPFKLTFHTARHTFATRALNKGMRIEYVSKIMDHSTINVTQIYAKVVNKELDKAMEIMNE